MNQWYEQAFEIAAHKTKAWGLDFPDTTPTSEHLNIKSIRETFHILAYINQWSFPNDMINRCIDHHLKLALILKAKLNLTAIPTIGDVYVNGKSRYKTTYNLLQNEIENPATGGNPRIFPAHVWLTFPNRGILDIVLPAALYYDNPIPIANKNHADYILFAGPEARRKQGVSNVTIPKNSQDGSFIHRDLFGRKRKLSFHPMIVGWNFLTQTDDALEIFQQEFERAFKQANKP